MELTSPSTDDRTAYDPAAKYPVAVRDIVYRQDGEQDWRARIYQPQGSGPFPAVLSVHGGAWTSDGWPLQGRIAEAIAASGVVVMAPQLRRAPRYAYPASVADVNYSTRWLKAHTHELNTDSSRVGGIGHSSGGHLVVLSALRPYDQRYTDLQMVDAQDVDARLGYLIALWSPIDPYARYRHALATNQTELAANSLGYFLTEEVMQEGNPQRILESGETSALPPLLLIHGTADTAVPLVIPERFATTYRAAGGEVELEVFPDMPHSFINRQPGPVADRALSLIKAFIDRQLAAPESPPKRAPQPR
jgi:acetyl esterase